MFGFMKRALALPPGYGRKRLWVYTVLSFVLFCVAVPWQGRDAGIPDPAALSSATGRVTWIDNNKYGVKFRLSGHAGAFDYPSKARGGGVVLDALSAAADQPVTVRYNPDARHPLLGGGEVFDVWEVAVGDRPVRVWSDAVEGWRADNAVRPWVAALFGFGAIYFAIHAWRVHRPRLG